MIIDNKNKIKIKVEKFKHPELNNREVSACPQIVLFINMVGRHKKTPVASKAFCLGRYIEMSLYIPKALIKSMESERDFIAMTLGKGKSVERASR